MLVVTIHDVAPPHLAAVRQLRERTAAWGANVVTLLAVPDYHGLGRLAECRETASWLRGCAQAGDEVALHGIVHRASGTTPGKLDRLRARAWTAGEAEMLGEHAPAVEQLAIERDRLTQLVGQSVEGFVAPAWLEPQGLARRLAASGFRWHETKWLIERLADRIAERRRVIAPAIGFATRTWLRERAALAWARLATPLASLATSAADPVRIALHPADLTSTRVMASAERTIRTLARTHAAFTTSRALAVA
jgi:hypothetical protein